MHWNDWILKPINNYSKLHQSKHWDFKKLALTSGSELQYVWSGTSEWTTCEENSVASMLYKVSNFYFYFYFFLISKVVYLVTYMGLSPGEKCKRKKNKSHFIIQHIYIGKMMC